MQPDSLLADIGRAFTAMQRARANIAPRFTPREIGRSPVASLRGGLSDLDKALATGEPWLRERAYLRTP